MSEVKFSFLSASTDIQRQQILKIYHDQGWWPRTVNDTNRIQRVIDGSHCFLVVTAEDQIIGFGRALSDRTGDAYIHDVNIRKEYRNNGHGHRIVTTLISRLKEDGITWVALIAENSSHTFYEKLNFKTMENSSPMFRWLI